MVLGVEHVELGVLERRLELAQEASHVAEPGVARVLLHDLALAVNPGTKGAAALARVLERWVAHFHGVEVTIEPVREIPDEDWGWHVGLDAEATAMLNDIYNGAEVDVERMKRIIGLFRMEFKDASAVRAELRGRAVFLGLAMAADATLRMKPQNLLMNLPLASRT